MKYFYPFILLGLIFSSALSCGGSSAPSADLNLSAQTCGNALVNENEGCDDGNVNNSDGCNAHCAWEVGEAICGNGVLENEECCDDGNSVSGDGCSAVCTSEKNNRHPSAPILAAEPANGATWAPTRLYLSWSPSTDPDAGDEVTYDVYFVEGNGISPTAFPYKQGITKNHFIIQASTDNRAEFFPDLVRPVYLEPEQTYTWKICARDKVGAQTCSTSRIFNTDNSVVGWWRFDEDPVGPVCPAILGGAAGDPGETVCDYSGKGNHGKPTGIYLEVLETNILGKAALFNSGESRVEVPNHTSLGLTSLSVFAKLSPSSFTGALTARILNKMIITGPDLYSGYNFDFNEFHNLRLEIANPAFPIDCAIGPTLFHFNQFYRIAGSFSNPTIKVYVDGSLEDMTSANLIPGMNASSLYIGRWNSPLDVFRGVIDEVLLMNRAVNEGELINDYLSTQP